MRQNNPRKYSRRAIYSLCLVYGSKLAHYAIYIHGMRDYNRRHNRISRSRDQHVELSHPSGRGEPIQGLQLWKTCKDPYREGHVQNGGGFYPYILIRYYNWILDYSRRDFSLTILIRANSDPRRYHATYSDVSDELVIHATTSLLSGSVRPSFYCGCEPYGTYLYCYYCPV